MYEIKIETKIGIEVIKASDYEENTNHLHIMEEREEEQNFCKVHLIPYNAVERITIIEHWERPMFANNGLYRDEERIY